MSVRLHCLSVPLDLNNYKLGRWVLYIKLSIINVCYFMNDHIYIGRCTSVVVSLLLPGGRTNQNKNPLSAESYIYKVVQ
jgi:hypothetical protein